MRIETPGSGGGGSSQFTRTVTSLLVLLLALAGSSFVAVTVARFVTMGQASAVAVTVIVTEALAPEARSPMLQVTFCPLTVQVPGPLLPPVKVAPSTLRPAGMASVTTTPVASPPPAFVTVSVKVNESPGFTPVVGAPVVLLICASGPGQTTGTVTLLLVLFPVFDAVSFVAVTVARFVMLGHAPGVAVTLMVTVAVAPVASVPMLQVTFCPLTEHVPGPLLPPVKVALLIVKPVGIASLTVTPVASAGPAAAATRVKLKVVPGATPAVGALVVFETVTSTFGMLVVHEACAVTVRPELAPTPFTVTVLTSGWGSVALTV